MTALISTKNLNKNFKFGDTVVPALQDISLHIAEGGMSALVGPSGSGKSTLLNLIAALDIPDSGSIMVCGAELTKLDDDERARFRNESIGFIFQNFNLIPVLTAWENVCLPAQLGYKVGLQDYKLRALELLEKVGLSSQANQSVNRLSGGQMQRVAIARAIMNQPRLILADEATANLDHATADKILQLLQSVCQDSNVSVVMATHDSSVLKYCSRVISLRDGRLSD